MECAVALNAIPLQPQAVQSGRAILREVRRPIPPSRVAEPHRQPQAFQRGPASLWDPLIATRMRIRKGATLYRPGDRFASLYVIRSGSCKTVMLNDDGQGHILGYHMSGDLVGVDGIGDGRHHASLVALEDGELCVIPFDRVEALARNDVQFQRQFYRVLATETTLARTALLMLASMRAEQRLAAFLLDLSRRYAALGYSSREFVLRLTREEIGSHLGLTLETVSRLFSRFRQLGIVDVQGRGIRLVDIAALKQLLERGLDEPESRRDGTALAIAMVRAA